MHVEYCVYEAVSGITYVITQCEIHVFIKYCFDYKNLMRGCYFAKGIFRQVAFLLSSRQILTWS